MTELGSTSIRLPQSKVGDKSSTCLPILQWYSMAHVARKRKIHCWGESSMEWIMELINSQDPGTCSWPIFLVVNNHNCSLGHFLAPVAQLMVEAGIIRHMDWGNCQQSTVQKTCIKQLSQKTKCSTKIWPKFWPCLKIGKDLTYGPNLKAVPSKLKEWLKFGQVLMHRLLGTVHMCIPSSPCLDDIKKTVEESPQNHEQGSD